MKSRTALLCALCLAALSGAGLAREGLPAFPGAEGFGAISIGGRGGRVIHVTNLNESGPGSFRAAVMTKGPRIIVFDVGGTIELKDELHIQGDNGRITIAGQTAPGGITFIGGTLCFPGWQRNKTRRTPDIIVRHLRVRGVHGHSTHSEGGDCMDIYRAERVIIDHCSFTGSCDETVDACHTQQYTFQWCTIEEPALWGQGNNQHAEGSHNYAFIFSYDAKNVSCHHNLFVHSSNRNPLITKGVADVRNNVVYNYHIGLAAGGTDPFNVVGNYMKSGKKRARYISPFYGMAGKDYYFHDNVIDLPGKVVTVNDPRKDTKGMGSISMRAPAVLLDKPNPVPHLGRTHSAREAYQVVLAKAGAWPRDATTRRCVREVRTRTGGYGLGGPYERLPERKRAADFDTDRDGMPDAWEKAHGLDPKDASDGNKAVPRGASKNDRHAGYTYVEYYLNELADGLVGAEAALCKVEMTVEGKGHVACESGGWTFGWHRLATPREVLWGNENVFNKGSTAVIKAVPQPGCVFSHWEGGSVDGRKEKRLTLTIEKDVKITAHFVPDPDHGKPVTAMLKQNGFTTEVKLFAYPRTVNAKVHGSGLAVGEDGNVYSVVGDGLANCHLLRLDPKTGKMTDLGGVQGTWKPAARSYQRERHGWVQGPPFQAADGAVYFATLANPGNNYGVWAPHLGGLFKYHPDAGDRLISRIRDGKQFYSLLHGDAKTGKLYVLAGVSTDNRQRSFTLRTYDTATGAWKDLGKIEMRCRLTKAVESALADGKGGFLTSFLPKGTTRFDMSTGKMESVDMAPGRRYTRRGKPFFRRFPWLNAVTDGTTAYVTAHQWGSLYSHTELYTFKPGDWPNIDVKPFASIDPKGRVVYSRHLSLTPDGNRLVIAGKCMGERFKPGQFDGVWVIDTATRKSQLVADITGLLKKSFKDDDIGPYANHYSGTNAVSRDGWIYIGVRKMPETFYPHGPDVATDLRLMGIRVTKD